MGYKMTNKKINVDGVNFNRPDSWAIWEVPSIDLTDKTAKEREVLFGEAYVSNRFPINELPHNLDGVLKQVKYVLVGLNPGDAGVTMTDDNQPFLNFHGQKKSMDYRLAAALYGTSMWGSFMTDLVHIDESDSHKVTGSQSDVMALEEHLDELGIPKTAVLVAMGGKSYKSLVTYAKRQVFTIPHYSGANGHWKAEDTRQKVWDVIEEVNKNTGE